MLIRHELLYAKLEWSPHKKEHKKVGKKMEAIATTLLAEVKELTYEERLKQMKPMKTEE